MDVPAVHSASGAAQPVLGNAGTDAVGSKRLFAVLVEASFDVNIAAGKDALEANR